MYVISSRIHKHIKYLSLQGDSGGPLWSVEEQTIYGILSYGRTPCQTGKPFAFTRLSVYSDWIDKEMANMLKQKA